MKLLVAIPPDKFRDDELNTITKVFEQNNVPWELVSSHAGMVLGMFGKQVRVTTTFEKVLLKGIEEYDGIVIISGKGTEMHLIGNRHLHELVRTFKSKEKVIGAIGVAPIVLAKARILVKREATVLKGPTVREMMIDDAIIVDKDIVYKDKIVTARGPETSEQFAKVIVEYLTGNPEFQATKSKAGFEF
ncbi:MAG: DJ-1/PfpI family protein [Methanospirillaceae archaeon]|nr:DJ-1/PfpI family protein [Methanospirillaceae archaeon]